MESNRILCRNLAVHLMATTLASMGTTSLLGAQTTSRVSLGTGSVQANNNSSAPSLSGNGRFVMFHSEATNLVPGDTNAVQDVFLRDRQTGVTTRVSVSSTGVQADTDSWGQDLTPDGRYVLFWSMATNLVPGDTNGLWDVFLFDRLTATTTRESVSSTGAQGNGSSAFGAISPDGRYITFHSNASNLVPADTNGFWDVFVRDRLAGTTTLVSVASNGVQANGDNGFPSISADGRFVAFRGDGSNLVPGDTNARWDLFVRDLVAGTTERISVATGGWESDGYSYFPFISDDGRYVAFQSEATNLVLPDANWDNSDIYVRDRVAGTTERVSVASDGTQGNNNSVFPSISADGRYVTFSSSAWNLVPNDSNVNGDVFLHDRQTGATVRASVDSGGGQLPHQSLPGNNTVSDDGRYVAFYNGDSFVPGDSNQQVDCFVRDLGPTFSTFCHGDGTGTPCPCGNSGQAGHGCENSAGTGGALLGHSGAPLPSDTVVLDVSGERANALTIFLQGDTQIAPVVFGDGLRCLGGVLKRLYVKSATGGHATAPSAGDPSITTRSSAMGDRIPPGATRFYMTYYRDAEAGFCASPGSTFNASNALAVVW